MDPDFVKKQYTLKSILDIIDKLDCEKVYDNNFQDLYACNFDFSNGDTTSSKSVQLYEIIEKSENVLVFDKDNCKLIKSKSCLTNKSNETLPADLSFNLIELILQNTIFSEDEMNYNMKLFSEAIREDIKNKCREVLKNHNVPIPMKKNILKFLNRSDVIGTSFQGYLHLDYNQIVELFGVPNYGPSSDGKVDWEWIFELNGEVTTIYNYKTGPSYSKKNSGILPNHLIKWHIGGKTKKVLSNLQDYLENDKVVQNSD